MRSDPVDGTLWVGSGDAHPHAVNATSYRPYDEQTLAGKIIHVDRNGRGLPGHPFCPTETDLTKTCTKIYAKGFRNPFRFTLRPGKGPVVGDVGANDREEIDLIKPGQNYGWPCYEGTVRTPLYKTQSRCLQEYAKEGTSAAATPPSWDYDHADGASIVGGAVYNGTRYPADYRGDIFVGDYVQGWVKRLDVDSSDRVTAVHDFASNWPTGVEIQSAPGDGDIAYTDLGWGGSGAIRSFTYSGATNAPPTAKAAATPTSGTPPLAVSFSSAGSSDPDGDTLSYSWDFGDGTPRSTAANPSHTYTTSGNYAAQLTVSDGKGNTDTETVTVSVGNSAPTASITAPVDESLYTDGGTVAVRGAGTDPEDGSLPESAYSWQVLLHHGSHLHEHTTATGSQVSFVTAIDHDADSYYEIRLTVTDSGGLKHTSSVDVRPQTSKLTLASSPAGAPLDYIGAQSGAAPFTRTAAVGYRATIAAAETFVKDGVTYRFAAWSDGGARQHEVTVPASDSTLTASYTRDTGVETLNFAPEADTWVDASRPTTSFGTSYGFRGRREPAGPVLRPLPGRRGRGPSGTCGAPAHVPARRFQDRRAGLRHELEDLARVDDLEHPPGHRRRQARGVRGGRAPELVRGPARAGRGQRRRAGLARPRLPLQRRRHVGQPHQREHATAPGRRGRRAGQPAALGPGRCDTAERHGAAGRLPLQRRLERPRRRRTLLLVEVRRRHPGLHGRQRHPHLHDSRDLHRRAHGERRQGELQPRRP